MRCYATSSIKNRETRVDFYVIRDAYTDGIELTFVRSATNPVDNHWQAGGSWADKERTVIAGRQCRLEAGTPACPSLRSSFHPPSHPSCHVSLASKPISYLHLRFLTFAVSTRLFSNLRDTYSDSFAYLYLLVDFEVDCFLITIKMYCNRKNREELRNFFICIIDFLIMKCRELFYFFFILHIKNYY